MRRKVRFLYLIGALLGLMMLAAACAGEEATPTTAPPVEKKPIVFADLNWDSAQLQNDIARFIVENGYGYPTDAVFGGTIPLFQGLLTGDIDVSMEIWLPNQQEAWDKALADKAVVEVGKSLDDNWQSMFVVPTYVVKGDPARGIAPMAPDLKSYKDIRNYVDLFSTPESGGKASLVGCIPGWECEKVNAAKVEAYGMEDVIDLQSPGSAAGLFASIKGAYEKGDPWLGYMWGPTLISATLDLTILEEPDCPAGETPDSGCAYPTAQVLIAVNPSLVERAPEIVEMLGKYDYTAEAQVAVEAWMGDNDASLEEGAMWFLKNNEDLWSQWVPADVAQKVKDALAAM